MIRNLHPDPFALIVLCFTLHWWVRICSVPEAVQAATKTMSCINAVSSELGRGMSNSDQLGGHAWKVSCWVGEGRVTECSSFGVHSKRLSASLKWKGIRIVSEAYVWQTYKTMPKCFLSSKVSWLQDFQLCETNPRPVIPLWVKTRYRTVTNFPLTALEHKAEYGGNAKLTQDV